MWPESAENNKPLRTGLTTGSCATACCVAAANLLLGGQKRDVVSITLPKGQQVELAIDSLKKSSKAAFASTIKDAGDDPDITHGAKIFVGLELLENNEVQFIAGSGVGTVTKDGLLVEKGEPAINPVPRKMMIEHLQNIATVHNYRGGFAITVGVEDGEVLAEKTMNPRLGIMGGLSILGTSGIVRPYSCGAWIASIYQGIDVAAANGLAHIAATTGNSSEKAIKQKHQLPEMALIEMGDFLTAVVKHLNKVPIAKLSLCGGFGKISKLANGHINLHSSSSSIDFDHLALMAKVAGADEALQQAITQANTSIEALQLCQQANIDLAAAVCQQALLVLQQKLPQTMELEVSAINRKGEFVGVAS